MRAPINSEKHIVQYPIDTILAGTAENIVLVQSTDQPTAGTANQVAVGTVVKAVFVECWIDGGTSQVGASTMIVEKTVNGGTGATFTEMAQLNIYTNKKNILYTTEGLTGDANTSPIPISRGWIKIPKGKQRFGSGDALTMTISAQADDQFRCGMTIFKSYN